MSTLQRYSWAERILSWCIILVRIPCWLLQLSWTWFFQLSIGIRARYPFHPMHACTYTCKIHPNALYPKMVSSMEELTCSVMEAARMILYLPPYMDQLLQQQQKDSQKTVNTLMMDHEFGSHRFVLFQSKKKWFSRSKKMLEISGEAVLWICRESRRRVRWIHAN